MIQSNAVDEGCECSECGENREGELIYQRSPANGDIWVCRTCGAETLIHPKSEEEES